ncbi:MAG TPA: DUF3320 domain-containing protein [Burkholderiales bacterium]|nr:DUF3320 domain-containing protein [Burkholderiales bacterium]
MTPSDNRPASIRLDSALSPRLNLAFHQNAVPFLRELVVVNESDAAVHSLEIALNSEPAFLKQRTWRVESVAAGERYHLSELDVALDGALLGRLTEAETAQVSFVIAAGGSELHRLESSVELLPRNHWGGLGHVPEMIAAFVQPNDPAVDRLLKKAADVLRQHGKAAALDGYQGGSKRAWELASAVWTALGSLGLDYALPPASFERVGQKVRSPGQIVDGGIATCLDTTLLFCAAIEQCGLNPLVVLTRGHAFAGVWLKAEDFTNAVVDDVTALRKRVKLNEMVLIETTLLAQRPCPAFSHAIDHGARHIAESEEDAFELVVDVRRARTQRIRPLSGAEAAAHAVAAPEAQSQPAFEEAPDLDDDAPAVESRDSGTPKDRLDRWQRKLLDLSLRNNLLNFRPSKRSVRLDIPDAGKVEDALALGRSLKLLPRPDLMDGADPRSQAIHESRHREDLRRQHALEALTRDEVLIDLPREELEGRLVELYRTARATLQEGGANTLYLALGFLSWTVADKDDKRCRAPLILVPVTLTRRSVRSGFSVALHEDEPRFNPTLLEMLRQDFKLVLPVATGELPRDERGLDIPGIWKSVAHAVKDIRGWEVVEDVVLATFSFAKYLMWKDLVDRTDTLRLNPVVRHLIDTPRDPYPGTIAFPDPRALDATHGPERTFCPLPSDSSQLAAILAAAQGKDFVLIGPPGTGKSQTISNLISQCLAEGKTVLFVSEKIAALDVVYRRLRAVELGEFCLELHSSKARKLDVLEQLRKAWNARGGSDDGAWQKEAQRLKKLRDELNVYVERLHRRHRNGLSPFAAMGRVVARRDDPQLGLSWPSADAQDEDALDNLRDLADRLDADLREVQAVAHGPLAAVAHSEWSPAWQQAFIDASRDLIVRSEALSQATAAFCEALALPEIALDARGRDGLAALARVLPQAARRDWRFVLRPDARPVCESIARGLELLARHESLTADLSLPYRPDALHLDLEGLQAQWNEAGATWWPRSWFMRRAVTGALARAASTAGTPNAGDDLPRLSSLRALEEDLAKLDDLREKTAGVWSGLATNIDEAGQALRFQQGFAVALGGLAPNAAALPALTAALESILGQGNALLEPTAAVGAAAEACVTAFGRFQSAHETWSGLAAIQPDAAMSPDLESLVTTCRGLIAQEPRLRAWCAWRRARTAAVAAGLGPLVSAMETGAIPPGSARDTFETAYCRWWINATVDRDEVLRDFVPAEHEKRIEDFRALDERYTALTRAYVRARLCAGLPDLNAVPKASEWGLLRREMEKKRRHLPLRELIGGIPAALTRLTPCLLMSPLSIAQYLPAGVAAFDVVIFDEASQIPVWDAVGAIARGRQVVMVGDPKQLPPTSFFERAEEDGDDDIEIDADLESILDECMGANLPTMNLAWHYRSRHESLIAFSNHRYYGGGLVTFPSPVTDDRAVSFHPVKDGLYEKGGARINKPEAQALVADLVARLKTPGFTESRHTIGVVTFNVEQQRLIEDLLDEERRKDASLEPHFAEDALEPVFVKNLESVQGDERDIMYFSVTYGPDKTGAVSMNFGPMNRDGGHRRLNVAVTRARHALRVYSTLTPDRIDLSRTQAIGVRDLKHFLEFAERGPRALAEAVFGSTGDHDSPFEQAVAEALAAKGWTVHSQVGVSAFRIDLGVVDPDVPGRYLAGLECDGATYHRSATARDRDKLREQVLRDLGWQIERIWSTDWWQDAQSALSRLHERLESLLAQARASRSAVASSPPPQAALQAHDSAPTPPSGVYAGAAASPATPSAVRPASRWIEADAASAVASVDAGAFHDRAYDATLEAMIEHVVALEAPLRADVLARRIARAHGWARTGTRIKERVLEIARQRYRPAAEGSDVFIWPAGHDTATWPSFRRPDNGAARPVDEIALPELIALAAEIRSQGFEGEAAIQAMARVAGLPQLRAASRARLELAWAAAPSA